MNSNLRQKEIYKVTIVGSIINMLLLVAKFVAGIVGHSAAMIADALHSLSDFVTDIIVVLFVRMFLQILLFLMLFYLIRLLTLLMISFFGIWFELFGSLFYSHLSTR